MRMTEYMDFMNRDKITAEDRYRYSHININDLELKEERKRYRKNIKKGVGKSLDNNNV